VHEERENCEVGVLLQSFRGRALFRVPFALLLFLRGLMYSIFSLVTGLIFVEKTGGGYLL
jgi:hypothetical protein